MVLLKRMALVINAAIIERIFYPVFPPDHNATEVAAWLEYRIETGISACNSELPHR
ncbi:MAG: hypothetical protein HKL95_00105 [Phycisphaerae bacterium]|nr:hypothetical protein [Phycisphaerae bacterium]